jgi:hypothetical protein
VIFLGGLIFLFYGYDCLRNRKYLRCLDSLFPDRPVFLLLFISRVIIIFLILLIILLCSVFLFMLNGIPFPFHHAMLNYLLTAFLCLVFFFALGIAVGKIKSHLAGIPVVIGSWLLLIFILPMAVNLFIAGKANNIPSLYELEMEKLRIIMNFEKQAIDKSITFKYGEKLTKETIDYVSSFIDNEFKAIHEKEAELRAQMLKNVRLHHLLSSLSPTTLYFSVIDEASSRGLENALLFQGYAQEGQKNFSRFYIVRVFYNDPEILISFIKGNENLFHARSRIPTYFIGGVFIQLFIILALFSWGAFRFKNWLIPSESELKSKKPFTEHEKNIRLKSKQVNVIYTRRSDLSKHLYLQFTFSGPYAPGSRRKESDVPDNRLHVSMDGQPLESFPGSQDGIAKARRFVFMCNPSQLPGDITPMTYISFMCRG